MKVYRFLNWTNHNQNGSANEINNFRDYGIISPSFKYLCKQTKVFKKGGNTFGDEECMSKYFFLSLADTLLIAKTIQSFSNILIEINIPNDIVKQYIGVGYYGDYLAECRIPYQILYELLAKTKQDDFFKAMNFYNRNLYSCRLEKEQGYQEIESLLLKQSYSHIYQKDRLSIYPLFCFEAKEVTSWQINRSYLNNAITDLMQIIEQREEKFKVEKHLKDITGIETPFQSYNPYYDKEKLFDYVREVIEDENDKQRLVRYLK